MVIREAAAADVAGILAIYQEAGIDVGCGFTVEEATAHLERFRAYPNYRVFVVLLKGEVVGTYSLLIMDNLAKRGLRSGIAGGRFAGPPGAGNRPRDDRARDGGVSRGGLLQAGTVQQPAADRGA